MATVACRKVREGGTLTIREVTFDCDNVAVSVPAPITPEAAVTDTLRFQLQQMLEATWEPALTQNGNGELA